ncbi:Splicing factor U2af 38 kDa subunit, partial [Caligus rogercresseyi]
MAEYLASIFGTEKDKIGACRHGERCSRIHNKPTFSQTINSAKSADGSHMAHEHYDNFFEDCFVEAEDKYGEVEEMNVCDNLGKDALSSIHTYIHRIPRSIRRSRRRFDENR